MNAYLLELDHFSENGTNSALAAQEKINLKAFGHLAWCALPRPRLLCD